ncbi:MAG: hypothetical protein WD734_02445 [Dehalococcoidia bacterium]
MAEAVLWGLRGNRELAIRNLRPPDVERKRIEEVRGDLDRAARQFARVVECGEGDSAGGALFGDVHERNRVAFEFAQAILGPDPMAGR